MEEKEIKRLLKLAIKKELSIQDVTDAILSLHNKELDKFRKSDVSGSVCDHKDTYIVSGVFGGKWCEKCKEMVDKQTDD